MVKNSSRRTTHRAKGRVMHLTSPSQVGAMEALVRRGPMTLVFVFSTTCPHCHTYMPIWKELCRQKQRRANMVSMEADVYQQTPMAAKKEVTGVPTVLFVDRQGRISEGEDIRNKKLMTTAVNRGVSEEQINSGVTTAETLTADSPIFTPSSTASSMSRATLSEPPIPGARVRYNPLPATPAQTVPSPQVGGSPWAAFLNAARQAAPAVALLGAYSMLPMSGRSSGLGAPRRQTRRVSRSRSRA